MLRLWSHESFIEIYILTRIYCNAMTHCELYTLRSKITFLYSNFRAVVFFFFGLHMYVCLMRKLIKNYNQIQFLNLDKGPMYRTL